MADGESHFGRMRTSSRRTVTTERRGIVFVVGQRVRIRPMVIRQRKRATRRPPFHQSRWGNGSHHVHDASSARLSRWRN